MKLSGLFRGKRAFEASKLYQAIVAQARQPGFYAANGVPDSVDGRFEMIALHMFLVLQRLKSAGEGEVAQQLFDTMFADMDQSLREMGAGDLGVGRRVRVMAEGLYGRIAAYEAGLVGSNAELAAALRRNLFGTLPEPGPDAATLESLSAYLREAASRLGRQPASALIAGSPDFPPTPGRL